MSNLHSDERPTPSLALGIATATRGSDHLRSRPAIDLYHLPEPFLRKIYGNPVPYGGPLTSDYRDYEGKSWMVFWQEMVYMRDDALALPESDPRRSSLLAAARIHAEAGLANVSAEHYEGSHWLASFATYLVTRRGQPDR